MMTCNKEEVKALWEILIYYLYLINQQWYYFQFDDFSLLREAFLRNPMILLYEVFEFY